MYIYVYPVIPQRVVRVKKMDEGEEEGAELTSEQIEALSQRMYHSLVSHYCLLL